MSTGLNQDWEAAFDTAPIDFMLRTPTTIEVEWSGNDATVDGRFTMRLDAETANLPAEHKRTAIRQLLGKLVTAIWQDRDAVVGRQRIAEAAPEPPLPSGADGTWPAGAPFGPGIPASLAEDCYINSPVSISNVDRFGQAYVALDGIDPGGPDRGLGIVVQLAPNHPAYLAGPLSDNEQELCQDALAAAFGEIFHHYANYCETMDVDTPQRITPPTRRDTSRPSPVLPRQREASHRERVDAARAIIQPWTKIDWENRDQFNPDGGRPIWLEDLTDRQLWDVFNWCVRYAEPLFLVYGRNTATVEIGSLFGNLGWLGGRQLMHGMCQEAARRNLFFPPDVWLFVRDHLIPQMPSEQTQPYRQTRTAELAAEQRRLLDNVRPAVVQPQQSFRRLRLDHLPNMENPAI